MTDEDEMLQGKMKLLTNGGSSKRNSLNKDKVRPETALLEIEGMLDKTIVRDFKNCFKVL